MHKCIGTVCKLQDRYFNPNMMAKSNVIKWRLVWFWWSCSEILVALLGIIMVCVLVFAGFCSLNTVPASWSQQIEQCCLFCSTHGYFLIYIVPVSCCLPRTDKKRWCVNRICVFLNCVSGSYPPINSNFFIDLLLSGVSGASVPEFLVYLCLYAPRSPTCSMWSWNLNENYLYSVELMSNDFYY